MPNKKKIFYFRLGFSGPNYQPVKKNRFFLPYLCMKITMNKEFKLSVNKASDIELKKYRATTQSCTVDNEKKKLNAAV